MKVEMARSAQWDMTASVSKREYRIFAAFPQESPPKEGFPVIYVLDANAVFATAVETLRAQSRRADKTGVRPAIVIGIGYPIEVPFASVERQYDYTTPLNADELPFTFPGIEKLRHGGAAHFLDFIECDLKPELERRFRVNRKRQTLVGHSLGGLFTLQVLLTRPSSFQNYVAGSPSIHWNKPFLYEQLAAAQERIAAAHPAIGVLIAVGERETSHGMIPNAKALAERLAETKLSGLEVQYRIFEDEGHVSLLPLLMSRAVRFASRLDA